MTKESKFLYPVTGNNQLDLIFQSLSDRIDKIEGRRGNQKFYSTIFEFSEQIGQGMVLSINSNGDGVFDEIKVTFGDAIYFFADGGDETTNGTYRIRIESGDLITEKLVLGVWNEVQRVGDF